MKFSIIIVFSIIGLKCWSQVGVNISNPDASSALEIYSIDKGFLTPRVSLNSSTDVVLPINTPTTGLLVWNTNPLMINGNGIGYYFFDGTQWKRFQRRGTLDQSYDQGGNGQGRTIVADAGAVRIDGTDGLMITGTFATGAIINTDVTGAGTRMFFNPNKSSLRAGGVSATFFDDANVGIYSFATGYDNRMYVGRAFGANYNNLTSSVNSTSIGNSNTSYDNAAFSSGNLTRSGGNNSFSTGYTCYAIGYNSFSNGFENRSNTINEFTIGQYARTPAKTNSSGTLFVDSQSAYYTTDRAFAIGNGNSITRNNAFEVWKNGRVMINSSYSLPTTDGTNKQKLTTNGTGTVTWTSSATAITQIPLYVDDTAYTMSNTSPALDLNAFDSGVIPTLFQSLGNVRVKLVVRYTNLVGTPNLRLRVHDGTVQSTPITTASGWTNTPTQTGGVYESTWRNWNAATGIYEAHLSGFMSNPGESITITNAYLLIAPQ